MKFTSNKSAFVWSAVFIFFSAVAGTGVTYALDLALVEASQRAASVPLDSFGNLLSAAGGWEFTSVLLLVLTGAMFWRGHRGLAVRIFVLFLATALLEFVLKLYLPVPPIPESLGRSNEFAPTLEIEYPYPYPSGHMLRSTILLGALYLWSGSQTIVVLAVGLLALMAATRIYLGVHWPSDLVGGVLLGVATVCWAFRKKAKT